MDGQDRQVFYRLAARAIGQGLLTTAERDIISRAGHRKECYWARHVNDLRWYIEYKTKQVTLP